MTDNRQADASPPTPPNGDVTDSRQLTFRAGGRVYACPVEVVREVVPLGRVTRLPGTPIYVLGLMNVRGEIVTVVDAGRYLHGQACGPNASVLLVDTGARAVGVAVETVADVRVLREDEGYQQLDVRAMVARVVVITEEE